MPPVQTGVLTADTVPRPVAAGTCRTTRLMFRSDPASVRRALRSVVETLARQPCAAGARDRVELVLAEVLNNVVEHAYADRPDGLIELSLDWDDGALRCVVTDTGQPMPQDGLPEGRLPHHGDLPEGGFGWYLIRSLTTGLGYARVADANRLTFVMNLDSDPH